MPLLGEALGDAHLDVRKAAVLALTRWAGEPAHRVRASTAALRTSRCASPSASPSSGIAASAVARDALGIALKDTDARSACVMAP
ncbi:hypothetical protein MAHJHV57_54740 [Mycobacterium avium subsp. hominissuis]